MSLSDCEIYKVKSKKYANVNLHFYYLRISWLYKLKYD